MVKKRAVPVAVPTFQKLAKLIENDLNNYIPAAEAAASVVGDRDALRVFLE